MRSRWEPRQLVTLRSATRGFRSDLWSKILPRGPHGAPESQPGSRNGTARWPGTSGSIKAWQEAATLPPTCRLQSARRTTALGPTNLSGPPLNLAIVHACVFEGISLYCMTYYLFRSLECALPCIWVAVQHLLHTCHLCNTCQA